MKSIILILPYFTLKKGNFPELFPLWLRSCGWNPTIHWLLLTDTKINEEIPDNVKVIDTTFAKVKNRIQNLYDFQISLENPYKLCDFRPAYGEIFAREIEPYDFWGFCDMDVIWGNLRKFLTDHILEKYERILTNGHLSLIRNEPKMNSAYRSMTAQGCVEYRQVFSSAKSFCFDEWGGTTEIFVKNHVPVYREKIFADIQTDRFQLRPTRELWKEYKQEKKNKHIIYLVKDGRLTCYYTKNGILNSQEFLYIHLQKRRMEITPGIDPDRFLIAPPNRILTYRAVTEDTLKELTRYTGLQWNAKGQIVRVIRNGWRFLRGWKRK